MLTRSDFDAEHRELALVGSDGLTDQGKFIGAVNSSHKLNKRDFAKQQLVILLLSRTVK